MIGRGSNSFYFFFLLPSNGDQWEAGDCRLRQSQRAKTSLITSAKLEIPSVSPSGRTDGHFFLHRKKTLVARKVDCSDLITSQRTRNHSQMNRWRTVKSIEGLELLVRWALAPLLKGRHWLTKKKYIGFTFVLFFFKEWTFERTKFLLLLVIGFPFWFFFFAFQVLQESRNLGNREFWDFSHQINPVIEPQAPTSTSADGFYLFQSKSSHFSLFGSSNLRRSEHEDSSLFLRSKSQRCHLIRFQKTFMNDLISGNRGAQSSGVSIR